MFIRRIRAVLAPATTVALALALTACGSDSGKPETGADGLTELTVAVSPGAATSTPMYLAVENGVFEDLGLRLDLKVLEDGSVAIPNTLNGQTQFSMSGFGAAAQAIEKGLGIKMIGAANVIPTDPESKYQAVIVNKAAGIKNMKDVRTWAADSTEVDPAQAHAVDSLGGNYTALKRVAVPFPAIGDTVADGTVDAALVNEPWLSVALKTGKTEILTYVTGELAVPGSPGAVFIGSDKFMTANPDVTEKFIRGVRTAYDYAADHMDEVARFVPSTKLNDQVPPVVALGEYQRGPLDAAKVQRLLDIFERYGAIKGSVPADKMIHGS
ncbi:ABC transporter substrate-binding protein [Sphaerimonospora sp. CA-214678]|uniref:ABC transporter substrate-binding protein n=1 Tax=Sphaerimonospora sp. CA-214678 TaxID=3240029 RepID=UPI003D8E8D08